ncbi:MAG: DUF2442 domain-containing protein [Clostridium sp.]|uniref:DUF2442 domain-containing protein n=1 Tax=Clostridium sp. TaxID=1506 RepID=UPI0025F4C6D7|nr:DUF2442 domain-containing protein [Clostridium sp.]MCI6691258.1 DUF2442 domain-containing protein [Clostridium sp.]MDY4252639.1 DUF2442 domain-containing protein [Clostridium sp.]
MLQPKIINVIPTKDYKLILTYASGEKKEFNVKPYISGDWYSELLSIDYFLSVKLISDGIGIEWPNGQDISPHELYENSISLSE